MLSNHSEHTLLILKYLQKSGTFSAGALCLKFPLEQILWFEDVIALTILIGSGVSREFTLVADLKIVDSKDVTMWDVVYQHSNTDIQLEDIRMTWKELMNTWNCEYDNNNESDVPNLCDQYLTEFIGKNAAATVGKLIDFRKSEGIDLQSIMYGVEVRFDLWIDGWNVQYCPRFGSIALYADLVAKVHSSYLVCRPNMSWREILSLERIAKNTRKEIVYKVDSKWLRFTTFAELTSRKRNDQ